MSRKKLAPRLGPGGRSNGTARIASIPDLVPYDEFREGRFFREWVEPQDWIDAANTVLEKSVTSCAYLSVIPGKAHGIISRPQVSRLQVSRLQVGRSHSRQHDRLRV